MSDSLLIIDPQNDFCDPEGSLFVPNADADCRRLADFIRQNGAKIDSMHITLDSHDFFNIAHPVFWRDRDGKEPPPYTVVSLEAYEKGDFVPLDPSFTEYARRYLQELEKKGKYRLTLWPPHCLKGTCGQHIQKDVLLAVRLWNKERLIPVDYVIKGEHPLTEHYSAIEAEVPVPGDERTNTNLALIKVLKGCDRVFIAGEALSHCVAFTVRDLASRMDPKKFVFLTDCSSSVPGFEAEGEKFLQELSAQGMTLSKSSA